MWNVHWLASRGAPCEGYISRERLPGQGGVRFTSDFHYILLYRVSIHHVTWMKSSTDDNIRTCI